MLRGIRKASENWLGRALMGVVMSVLVVSFGIWGINDIFHGFGRSSLAKIGKVEIPIEQFRQAYQDRLEQISRQIGHPVPPDQALAIGLDKQVLGEMIGQAALDQRARQMRLGISDDEVARHITSDPSLQSPDGKFDQVKFSLALHNMGLTEQRFITDRRETALRRQILDTVSGNISPPQAWLDAINQFQNEQRSIQYLTLGRRRRATFRSRPPTRSSKYFDERKILFRAPETRKIATVTVTPAALAKWMEISDDDVKHAYDERRFEFYDAGAPPYRADRVPEYGGRSSCRRPHQKWNELRRHRRRARPQAAGLRSRLYRKIADRRARRCRRGIRAQGRRSQRAGPGAVRCGHCHRTQDRPRNDEALRRRGTRVAQRHRARARQGPGAGHSRQDRGYPRRRRLARRGGGQAEASRRDL